MCSPASSLRPPRPRRPRNAKTTPTFAGNVAFAENDPMSTQSDAESGEVKYSDPLVVADGLADFPVGADGSIDWGDDCSPEPEAEPPDPAKIKRAPLSNDGRALLVSLEGYRRPFPIATANELGLHRLARLLNVPPPDSLLADFGRELEGRLVPVGAIRSLTPKHQPGTLVTARASDVAMVAVDWLWRNWIPCGGLTSVQGQMGSSKGTWLSDLAARVTRGDTMPDGSSSNIDEPGDVVWLSGEDAADLTLRARFEVAGADLHRIHIVEGVIADDGSIESVHAASLENVAALRELIVRTGARLVVVDPLTCFTGGKDINRSTEMRQLLSPLSALSSELGVAIVLVRHMRKESASALMAAGGAVDISALCRCVLVTGEPPPEPADEGEQDAEPDPSARIITSAKNNLGPKPAGRKFSVIAKPLTVPTRSGGSRTEEYPAVVWGGATDVSADAVNAQGQGVQQATTPQRSKGSQAASAIINALSDVPNRWLPTRELETSVCAKLGCKPATYRKGLPPLKRQGEIWAAKRGGKETIYGLSDAEVPEGFEREASKGAAWA